MIYLVAAAIFVAVGLLIWSVLFPALTRRSVVLERLGKISSGETAGAGSPLKEADSSKLKDVLTDIGSKVPLSSKDQSKYARQMTAAGYGKGALPIFMGSKLVLAVGLPLLYIVGHSFALESLRSTLTLMIIAILAIIGFLLPTYWLRYKLNKRQTQIFHTLPDILDLITVCVEAGLSMDAALIKATETPQFANDPLAQEIKVATREARAGKPRAEALKDMAERTMVEDVKAFVTMLAQTERFGTSLSQALRVHSDSLRTKRRQLAEEAAAKTTIKLVFPLVFFIFPALMVVLLGPAFIGIRQLMKHL